jgi:hypothetical protein
MKGSVEPVLILAILVNIIVCMYILTFLQRRVSRFGSRRKFPNPDTHGVYTFLFLFSYVCLLYSIFKVRKKFEYEFKKKILKLKVQQYEHVDLKHEKLNN